MNSFKRFRERKFPDKECFYSSSKGEATGDNGKKIDGHISDNHCLKQYFLLLADVFEKFICTCLKFYKLQL